MNATPAKEPPVARDLQQARAALLRWIAANEAKRQAARLARRFGAVRAT